VWEGNEKNDEHRKKKERMENKKKISFFKFKNKRGT
jgi:hypothetical protein